MLFVIANQKGGTGKSSIAQTLAIYLKTILNKDILLVDADPQRTTGEWADQRSESDLIPIPYAELTRNNTHSINDFITRYEHVVIDCGGADSKAMRTALALADVALLPFRPKRRDLKVAPDMAEIMDNAVALNKKLQVFSCVTQCPTLPSQGYRIESAKALLSSLDLKPLNHITRNLNDWDDAEESGHSVLEWKEKSKARDDALSIFGELLERIGYGK